MKKIPFVYCVAAFFLLLCVSCGGSDAEKVKIRIGESDFKFEVADTAAERSKGLMFRKKLDKNSGMIFVYSYADYRHFYMKNTIIPLDIAFIAPDLSVINIEEMQPLDESTVSSMGKAIYILEANRGFFKKCGLNVGDKIEILSPLKYYP